jgi:hypothetical protein
MDTGNLIIDTDGAQDKFPTYSSDTSSIINGCRSDKGKIVLEYLANTGRLKITPGIFTELEIGRDEVFDWVYSKQNLIVQEITLQSARYIDHLLEKYAESFTDNENAGLHYCGLIKGETVNDADPEVIALARENNYVVLADEKSGIKGACKLEDIPCISLSKLIEIEYPRADKQLSFL